MKNELTEPLLGINNHY